MKKYKKFILLGIILSLLLPVYGLSQEKYEERELLMEVLEATGATFLEGDINLGGTLLNRFIGEEEMLDIGNTIKERLDIIEDDNYWDEIVEEDGFRQLTVQGYDYQDNLVTFSISSYRDVDDKKGETSLFINLINDGQFFTINDIILTIEKFFEEYHMLVNITTCVIGTFDGYVDLKENEKKVVEAAKMVKGKIVEEYKEDSLLSFSIFTPYIEEYIYTGSNKMNLNIALRYNEYEDKTYIWIGTPIITIGY